MRQALHFGAGNIGRGFIAPILQENNYEVVFVDVNEELIEQINTLKGYKINSISLSNNIEVFVENIRGILLKDKSILNEAIASADLITTSVGPKFVKDIFKTISDVKTDKSQSFIAFENMYRASTINSDVNSHRQLTLIDAVVDKIVPPQKSQLLEVIVENFGSIILDEKSQTRPLDKSKIVAYKNYDNEFYKKLWLLNGLHLKLAYFALSKQMKYTHEVLDNYEGKEFAMRSINSLARAYNIFSNSKEDLTDFCQIILDRFSLPEIQDEVVRIARNPEIKFSRNERFERPLRYLIDNNEDVDTFKEVLDIIFSNNFTEVEGFSDFKNSQLCNERNTFYSEFWKVDSYSEKYIKALGN